MDGAITQLEAGVKLAPDSPPLRFTLASAYRRAGRTGRRGPGTGRVHAPGSHAPHPAHRRPVGRRHGAGAAPVHPSSGRTVATRCASAAGPPGTRKDRPLLRPRTAVALVTLGILAAATAPAAQSAAPTIEPGGGCDRHPRGRRRARPRRTAGRRSAAGGVRDPGGWRAAGARRLHADLPARCRRRSGMPAGHATAAHAFAAEATPQASAEALAMPTEGARARVRSAHARRARAGVPRRRSATPTATCERTASSACSGSTCRSSRTRGTRATSRRVRKALDAFANRATSQFSGSREDREQLAARQAAAGAAASSAEQAAAGGGPGAGQAAGAMGGAAGRDADGGDAVAHAADLRDARTRPARVLHGQRPDGGRVEHAEHARPQGGHLLLRRALDPAERRGSIHRGGRGGEPRQRQHLHAWTPRACAPRAR